MSGKARPRDPQPQSLEVINRHNRHDPHATWRKKDKKPVPMKNKPGWFEDRR